MSVALRGGMTTAAMALEYEGALVHSGEIWTLEYAGRTAHVPHHKGLVQLAILLARPGELVAATTLLGEALVEADAIGERGSRAGRIRVCEDRSSQDPVLDPTALRQYRVRLRELLCRRDRIESNARVDQLEELDQEIGMLSGALASATGVSGRVRSFPSTRERARVNVRRTITASFRRVSAVHPELGEHLRANVRTGASCCYLPDPRHRIYWRF